jgi:hypothetical protein
MTGIDTHLRSPTGVALEPAEQEETRALLKRLGARRFAVLVGISAAACIRASSGLRVLPGTKALILAGLDRLRADAHGTAAKGGGR